MTAVGTHEPLPRCRFCGQSLPLPEAPAAAARVCARCNRVKRLLFVVRQGDGLTGFREVMLGQNVNEPNRKLLETQSLHFTVFVDEGGEILGFELADADEAHLLKWHRGKRPQFYRVENVGKGYHNRDELRLVGKFQATEALAELARAGHNLRPEVRDVLLEGIKAYGRETRPPFRPDRG